MNFMFSNLLYDSIVDHFLFFILTGYYVIYIICYNFLNTNVIAVFILHIFTVYWLVFFDMYLK